MNWFAIAAMAAWMLAAGIALCQIEELLCRIGYPRPLAILVAVVILWGLMSLVDLAPPSFQNLVFKETP